MVVANISYDYDRLGKNNPDPHHPQFLQISSLHKFISGGLRWQKKFISGKCTFSPTSPLAFSLHTILDKEDNQQAFVLIKKKAMGSLPPTSAFSGTHFTSLLLHSLN